MKITKKLQNTYREYKALEAVTNALEDKLIEYENDKGITEALEPICDQTYTKYWRKREELVKLLMSICKIERQTANRMMCDQKFADLMSMTIVD